LTRREYDALIARTEELEDALAARMADDGSRIPHEVALALTDGERPAAKRRDRPFRPVQERRSIGFVGAKS